MSKKNHHKRPIIKFAVPIFENSNNDNHQIKHNTINTIRNQRPNRLTILIVSKQTYISFKHYTDPIYQRKSFKHNCESLNKVSSNANRFPIAEQRTKITDHPGVENNRKKKKNITNHTGNLERQQPIRRAYIRDYTLTVPAESLCCAPL